MVISCLHTLDRTRQQTWLQEVPHVIFVGVPTLATQVEFSDHTRLCKLRCNDDYDSLPTKVWLALRFMKDTYDPEYLFKVDDDVILRPALLSQYLEDLKHYEYAGNVAQYPFATYCGGPLYYLSRKAIACLYSDMIISLSTLEDLTVGYSLAEHSIYPTSYKLLANSTSEEFESNPSILALHDDARKYFKNRSKQYEVAVATIPPNQALTEHKHAYAKKIQQERAAFDARTRQLKSKFSLIL